MSELPSAFAELVREAAYCEEAFDNWDNGKTWAPLGKERSASLDEITQEWDAAREKLVRFVMENGEQLLTEMRGETSE